MRECEWCSKPVSTKRGRAVCPDCRVKYIPNPARVGARQEEWDKNRANIAQLYYSGLTMREVGKKLGITKQAVSLVLISMGASRRPFGGPRKEVDMVKAVEMRMSGKTFEEIARQMGCSIRTIRSRLKDFPRPKLPETHRYCHRCHQTKLLTEFYKIDRSTCKECRAEINKDYRERNREKVNATTRRWRRERKAKSC